MILGLDESTDLPWGGLYHQPFSLVYYMCFCGSFSPLVHGDVKAETVRVSCFSFTWNASGDGCSQVYKRMLTG